VVRGLTNGLGFGSTGFMSCAPLGPSSPSIFNHYFDKRHSARQRCGNDRFVAKREYQPISSNKLCCRSSVAEQERIVANGRSITGPRATARQRLAKVPAILKAFRQSGAGPACSGRLTADWRETNPRSERMEPAEDADQILEEWVPRKLREVVLTLQQGGSPNANSTLHHLGRLGP